MSKFWHLLIFHIWLILRGTRLRMFLCYSTDWFLQKTYPQGQIEILIQNLFNSIMDEYVCCMYEWLNMLHINVNEIYSGSEDKVRLVE